MVMGRHSDTITAQRERIAELEARLAAIPLAALERHIMGIDSAADYSTIIAYFFPQEATA